MVRPLLILLGAMLVVAMMPLPAQALTMKECSAKFQAARKAGTLKGQKWNDFRKAECADDDASDDDAAALLKDEPKPAARPASTAAPAARAAAPAAPAPAAPQAGTPASPTRAVAVVYPKAVSQKYADETAGRARLKTCADQYNANKARSANGELRWIQTGGGYWSECNKRLKG